MFLKVALYGDDPNRLCSYLLQQVALLVRTLSRRIMTSRKKIPTCLFEIGFCV
jgi:hypothetical protein